MRKSWGSAAKVWQAVGVALAVAMVASVFQLMERVVLLLLRGEPGGFADSDTCEYQSDNEVRRVIPPIRHWFEIGNMLQADGLRTGAFLGLGSNGEFASHTINSWRTTGRILLVDTNENALKQVKDGEMLKRNIFTCLGTPVECAPRASKAEMDFVFFHYHQDRVGTAMDLASWWPKLRKGGVAAGWGFVRTDEGPSLAGLNWTHNIDGTIDSTGEGGRGAVEDFFSDRLTSHYRQIYVCYQKSGPRDFVKKWGLTYNVWIVRK